MKLDKFIGVLLILFLLVIASTLTNPDFEAKNPALAELLGMTSVTVNKPTNSTATAPVAVSGSKQGYGTTAIKIIGASVSFDNSYNQVILYVEKGSSRINLSKYILKTKNGAYNLPAILIGAGDYLILTSNSSPDGRAVRRVSPGHYQIYLSQRFLSLEYETVELYSSTGVLASKYSYELSTFLQN